MTGQYKKLLILIAGLFFGMLSVFGANAYKNELIKVGFSPLGVNDVKVTLYTAKPYSEPLRLLKKNDSEFVLILPETYNSAPQKPSISDVIGEVTDADIRLYSFVSNSDENGYTKIVIRTNGSINLYPEAVTIGGGRLAANNVNNAITSQIKPKTNTQNTIVQNQPPKQTVNKVKPEVSQNKIENKTNKTPSIMDKITKKTEVKKEEAKPQKDITNVTKPVSKTELPPVIEPLPNIDGKYTPEEIKPVPLEEIVDENPPIVEEDTQAQPKAGFITKTKLKILSVASVLRNKMHNKNLANNILMILGAILFAFISVKAGLAIINSARIKQKTAEEKNTEEENSTEYSSFFKTLIDSEVKGSNAFQLGVPSEDEMSADLTVEPLKSHKEVMNIDQNLSWQEKFRAVQNNKKALLNEDEEENEYNTNDINNTQISEIDENMHIENPIKKLKQDFKAVRKVLEKQKNKQTLNGNDLTTQNFVPEKIEKVEVISFEDYQKEVEPPKVQIKASVPLKSKPPKVLAQLPLANEKGLYLIDYNDKVALIGYIKDKVFKLSTYSSLNDTKIYARMTESEEGKETYIVKFDNNKLLVDIVDEKMQLKLVY